MSDTDSHRWNRRTLDNGTREICRGLHERSAACEWEPDPAPTGEAERPKLSVEIQEGYEPVKGGDAHDAVPGPEHGTSTQRAVMGAAHPTERGEAERLAAALETLAADGRRGGRVYMRDAAALLRRLEWDSAVWESRRGAALELYHKTEAALTQASREIRRLEKELAEKDAQLGWIVDALAGRPVSDFALSFPLVRQAEDMVAVLNRANQASLVAEARLAAKDAKIARLERDTPAGEDTSR